MAGPEMQPIVIRNARVVDPSQNMDERGAVVIVNGHIVDAGASARNQGAPEWSDIVDVGGAIVAPGLVDMRVFVGEPGAEHRETIKSASRAAAAGGVTTMITQPDTDPAIDDPALVDYVLRRARDTARVNVRPMAAVTKGLDGRSLTEIGLLTEAGAVAFTEGRKAIKHPGTLVRALTYARDFDGLIVQHVEDPDLVGAGVMNNGEAATRLGLPGIPHEAETTMLARDVRLALMAKGKYHAAQLSAAESLDTIRWAKDRGEGISCGVSAFHATLNETDIGLYRTFFKLSPPLRTEDDRRALVEALSDGTVDVVVSSHDPQDVETKRHPFAEANDGAIGLETLLPALWRLVLSDDLTLSRLIELTSVNPARLLGLDAGTLRRGAPADLIVFDPKPAWLYREADIISRSKNTAYEGARFEGRVIRTIVGGQTVYVASPGVLI